MRYSLALASLATLALAKDTQIQFFIPGLGPSGSRPTELPAIVDPVASIVSADASTTVMALACPSSGASADCPWDQVDMTVSVIGKSVYGASYEEMSMNFVCTSKKDMTCTAEMPLEATDAGSFTEAGDGVAEMVTVYPSGEFEFHTARVTAGVEKLAGGGGEGSGSAVATGSSTLETSAASTGAAPTATGAEPTGTATGSGAPAEASGVAGRLGVEGVALFALAGAAVVNVL